MAERTRRRPSVGVGNCATCDRRGRTRPTVVVEVGRLELHCTLYSRPRSGLCEAVDLRLSEPSVTTGVRCCPSVLPPARTQRGPGSGPVWSRTPSALRSSATRDRIGQPGAARPITRRARPHQDHSGNAFKLERERRQLIGRLTMVVRSTPGLTVRHGTRVQRATAGRGGGPPDRAGAQPSARSAGRGTVVVVLLVRLLPEDQPKPHAHYGRGDEDEQLFHALSLCRDRRVHRRTERARWGEHAGEVLPAAVAHPGHSTDDRPGQP